MADGSVVIEIVAKDKNATKTFDEIENSLEGIPGKSRKVSSSFKDIVSALGLVKLASAAFNVLRDSISGAIDRVDIMNRFPKMMQEVGFSAEESTAAIEKLSDGIQGLPTTLPDVTATAQQLAIMTGDLELATDLTLALNNAFLASGASTEDASRGLEQYRQMLSTGKVDMQSWRTLQETMGIALNDVAESFGYAGESAQSDLYSALQAGEIPFSKFNERLIELSEKTGGFADRALTASEGIGTSFQNIKTAVVTGLGNMIQAVDDWLQKNGFGSIAENLDKAKVAIQGVFSEIVEAVPSVLDFLTQLWDKFKELSPIILPLVGAITGFVIAVESINKIQSVLGIIKNAGGLFTLLKTSVMGLIPAVGSLSTPFLIVAGVIAAVIGIGVLLWQNWDWIKQKALDLGINIDEIWNSIKETVMTVVDVIVAFVQEIIGGLVTWWQENNQMILEATQNVWNFIKNIIEVAMNFILNIMQVVWPLILAVVKFAWDGIKNVVEGAINVITGIIEFFSALFTGNWEALWESIKKIVKGAVQFVWGLIQLWIVGKIIGAVKAFAGLLKSIFSSVWASVKNIFSSSLSWIWGKVSSIFSSISGFISSIMSTIRGVISGGLNAIKGFFSNIFGSLKGIVTNAFGSVRTAVSGGMSKALSAITNFFGRFKDAGANIIKNIASGISGAVGKVTDAIGGVLSKARDLLPFSPPKDKSSPLVDIHKNGITEQIAKGIYSGEDDIDKAMKDILHLPDVNQVIPTNIQLATANAGSGNGINKTVNNDNGNTIIIEKIENYSDSDIPTILEQASWILDRGRSRLDG